MKRRCLFCGRLIGVNDLTDRLRFHKVPAGDHGFAWITEGDPCPGIGSTGRVENADRKDDPNT
jgi:hypothetical protein